MIVTVNVTAEHIEHGERLQCTTCPVALALNEQLPVGAPWRVDNGTLTAITGKFGNMPLSVRQFVSSFDSQVRVAPFSFEIDVPEEWA